MNLHITNLEILLNEEINLYNKLLELEQYKSEAIINRNGSLIEQLSSDQEIILNRVAELEKDRRNLIRGFMGIFNTDSPLNSITLKDVASRIDRNSSDKLIKTGNLLKQLLLKIRSVMETNEKLLNDNIDLFRSLLTGVKKSMAMKTGYSGNGKEESKVESSLVFNRKI